MILNDARENYSYFSQKLSDIVRQLGFAGIGLIWIFKIDRNEGQMIPCGLLFPTCLIAIGLMFDFFQYLGSTIIWGIYSRCNEKKGISEKKEFQAPREINWPNNTFFILKITTIILAYIFLINYLINKIV